MEIIFSDGQEGYEYELLGTHNIEKSATAANGALHYIDKTEINDK